MLKIFLKKEEKENPEKLETEKVSNYWNIYKYRVQYYYATGDMCTNSTVMFFRSEYVLLNLCSYIQLFWKATTNSW